ncbi:MAG: hypothetical protein GEU26_09080 [Nitrososphaeraceae archaeon]|nr:hypothetical protein [Nitrososphaeraceae archaeon]
MVTRSEMIHFTSKEIQRVGSRYANKVQLAKCNVKSLLLEDSTFKRLSGILSESMHVSKRDLTYDDLVNELIDVYQEHSWGTIGAGAGGG